MPESVFHEVNQTSNIKSTSLSASRKDFISTWPPCLWTSASSLLEALCTILPLPSTLHLCSLIFRKLHQKYSGAKKYFFPAASTSSNQRLCPSDTITWKFGPLWSFTEMYSAILLCQWLCFQDNYPRCDSTTDSRNHSSPQLEQSSSLQPKMRKHF